MTSNRIRAVILRDLDRFDRTKEQWMKAQARVLRIAGRHRQTSFYWNMQYCDAYDLRVGMASSIGEHALNA
jgi:hypothetical protein